MKVILLKAVPKVGKKDEIVDVAQGYAQNSLFPKNLAILATEKSMADLKRRLQGIKEEKEMKHNLLDKAIEILNGKKVEMKVKANEKGNLFSKIHENDIAKYLESNHRISIDPKIIKLENGPIKTVGTHDIVVKDDNYESRFSIYLAT